MVVDGHFSIEFGCFTMFHTRFHTRFHTQGLRLGLDPWYDDMNVNLPNTSSSGIHGLLKDSVAVAVRQFVLFVRWRDAFSHLKKRVHLGELRASGKCLFRFCMGQNWVQMDPPMYGRFEDFGPNFGGPMILAHAPCMFFNSDDSSDPAG